ncbi:DNA-directed DNA polymerase [Tanacetum coccineum]
MNERCSAVLLNKLPSKEKDPGSFTIPCDIGQLHINNTLADLGASISLMPYTMYEKLGLGKPKTTRMSLKLADRSIQYLRGIIENVLIKVDKFVVLPVDFVFSRRLKNQSIKRPPTEDDECHGIKDLDDTIKEEAQKLLANEEPDFFLSRGLEKSIDQSNLEGCEPVESKTKNDSDSVEPIRRIVSINTPYLVMQEIAKPVEVEREHLYAASANEIDEKKHELKDLPHHLEYAFMHGDKSFPIIISSELSKKENISLLHVLEKRKGAIAWNMSDIKGIGPSYYTHKILMKDNFKPIIQPQRRLNPKVLDVVKNEIVKLLDFEIIYPISDSSWMLERLCGNEYYFFLDGFSGFFQIPIAPEDQKKTTFTCPYGTFAYRRMPFGLFNAPATFQRCMMAIFHDMVEDFMEIFMDDFSVFGFDIEIKDKRGAENLAADHLSRLENPDLGTFTEEEVADEFPDEHIMVLKTELNNDEALTTVDADDLEEMDLKWQMAMLTMRARRFLNKTGKKISSNGSETIGFNKSKVECYNCHKKGHFTRECKAPRENRNREPVRRNVTVETIERKALVAQDGLGYDWRDQAEEGPTNFALMAYTSSISSSSDSEVSTCSKACLKSYKTLKEHYDNLTKDFNKSQLNVGAYKAGLSSVEARLDVYKKNEVIFEEDIKILKLDIMLRYNALTELRKKFEKAKKERDDLKLTLEKFKNLSKNLSKLLEIQVCDKFKTGVGYDSQVVDSQVFDCQENDKYKTGEGYHAVPPPYTGNFMPPKPNLVLADEEEYVFSKSITSVPAVETSKVKTSESKHKYVGEPLIED